MQIRLVFENILSHNQATCLVGHALDPVDVLQSMSSMETIKSSSGQLSNNISLSMIKEIFHKFCAKKDTNTIVEIVDMYHSDHAEVSQVESTDMEKSVMGFIDSNYFQTLEKTPLGSCTLFKELFQMFMLNNVLECIQNLEEIIRAKSFVYLLTKAIFNWSHYCQYVEDIYYKFSWECFPDAFIVDSNTHL